MRLWFGKFQGETIQEIPDDYLSWLGSQEIRNDKLRIAVEEEQHRRWFFKYNGNAVNMKLLDELVFAGIRSLARKYHPDAGGSKQKMQEINNCADWIKLQARELLVMGGR